MIFNIMEEVITPDRAAPKLVCNEKKSETTPMEGNKIQMKHGHLCKYWQIIDSYI